MRLLVVIDVVSKLIGIYKITNTKNGKVYIGQTNNIGKRKEQHFSALDKGKHENKLMQTDYNSWKSYFTFEIVEQCYLSLLNEREKYWIGYYKADDPRFGYNLTAGGGSRKRKNAHNRPTCLLDELTD